MSDGAKEAGHQRDEERLFADRCDAVGTSLWCLCKPRNATMSVVYIEFNSAVSKLIELYPEQEPEEIRERLLAQYTQLYDEFIARRNNCPDAINPNHYIGGIECIDAIAEQVPDFSSYIQGNIIKYIWRYRDKGGVEDLKKARCYLNRLIQVADAKIYGKQESPK